MPTAPKPASRSPFMQKLAMRFAASRFLTTSLLIHVALITLLGSVVVFKAAQEQIAFEAAVGTDGILTETMEEPQGTEEATPLEFEEPAASPTTAPAAEASAITTTLTTPSSFALRASGEQQTFGKNFGSGDRALGTTGLANHGKSTASIGGGAKLSGSLFGVKIETAKLGVLVDVSGSAHPFLQGAFEEVEKSFKGMPTILVFGCGGLEKIKRGDFEVKPASRSEKDYEEGKSNGESVFGQVANARKNKNLPELDKYLEKLLRRKDVYWSVNDKSVNPRFGVPTSMEFLADQGVDTIYWFADFADQFEVETAEKIAKKLRAKGVKVIAHNFSENKKPTGMAAAELIVSTTGGQLIQKPMSQKPAKK